MTTIKVALVEDQALFRHGLHALLRDVPDFQLLAAVGNGRELLDFLEASQVLPDVIVADMKMPEMNGMELTEEIQKRYKSIRIVVLSVYNQERYIVKMIEAGVAGYLAKNCEIKELVLAIRTAHKAGFYFNESTIAAMRNAHKYKGNQLRSLSDTPLELTLREAEVLKLICQEYTNLEIADMLCLSVRTVDGHRNKLLAKVGCKNTAGLVLFAVQNFIFEPSSL